MRVDANYFTREQNSPACEVPLWGADAPEGREVLIKLHFYVLIPNCDRKAGYFVGRQPSLNYMERLIRLLAANRDIKIQKRGRNGISEDEEDRFPAMVCPKKRYTLAPVHGSFSILHSRRLISEIRKCVQAEKCPASSVRHCIVNVSRY